MINHELKKYIEENIIPNYANFDKGHSFDHVETVIKESLNLADKYNLNTNMTYTIAAYHDLGLCKDRKTHHLISGEILIKDNNLSKWFDDKEIRIMKEAVEDHRASSKTEPRSIYGKVIAEADRSIEPISIIKRTIQYSIKNSPDASKEVHHKHLIEHMQEKYAEGGYMKLWLESEKNLQGLKKLREIISDKNELSNIFEKLYEEINLKATV